MLMFSYVVVYVVIAVDVVKSYVVVEFMHTHKVGGSCPVE